MKFLWPIFFLLFTSCAEQNNSLPRPVEDSPYTLYSGGDIITMSDDSQPSYAEAVVTEKDTIVFVGDLHTATTRFPSAELHNLNGRTMMPGFIEPHVHPSLAATILPNKIIAPYDWNLPQGVSKGVQSQAEYVEQLRQAIHEFPDKSDLFFTWGYHQLWHGELSRSLLNDISQAQPIAVIHRSFHEVYLNNAALKLLDVTEEEFSSHPQVDWTKGHFYEGGWMALAPKMAPLLTKPERYLSGLMLMTQLIRKNGITTIAEPGFPNINLDGEYQLLRAEMSKQPPYDVYLIPNGGYLAKTLGGNTKASQFITTLQQRNTDNIHFLTDQVKLFSDGAIYSQAMKMKQPYSDGHEGEWMTPPDILRQQISHYWNEGFKIHMHANGDKGIQQVLDFVNTDNQQTPRDNHGFTLHHMGYFTDAMAEQIAQLNVEASVNPYYLWALSDKYAAQGLGEKRATNLVAINSLARRKINTSYHSDFAMAPMEPLTLAWTAINRVTSGGNPVSQDQRVNAYTAMKAITISAAKTLNLAHKIGSIEFGKTANFVLLDKNPLKIEPIKIKDIKVLATVHKGQFHINKSANLKPILDEHAF
jgi:predicted amidohydrolase YtcJ